jgi:hypothetical protein
MAKTAQEYEQEFLATIQEATGHSLDEWMHLLGKTGLSKTKETTDHLKKDHGLNHHQATLLSGIFLNDGKPVYDYAAMTEKLFHGLDHQRPLFDSLSARITAALPQARITPTKTYFSLDGERCFGAIKVNKTNVRVGMDLGDLPFGDYVEKAKSLGTMPRISHMIEIKAEDQISDDLLSYLRQAYERVHGP